MSATAVVITWAGLTKAGYIPNYLRIEFLNTEDRGNIEFLKTEDGGNLVCPPGQVPRRNCGMLPSGEVCGALHCEDETHIRGIFVIRVKSDHFGRIASRYTVF